jgi:hypothetical protein
MTQVVFHKKPKVYKQPLLFTCPVCHPEPQWPENPWVVVLPYGSQERFSTWGDAIEFALSYRPPIPMNLPAFALLGA